jgi:hypothetical protein
MVIRFFSEAILNLHYLLNIVQRLKNYRWKEREKPVFRDRFFWGK